jgi:hypothetical protein
MDPEEARRKRLRVADLEWDDMDTTWCHVKCGHCEYNCDHPWQMFFDGKALYICQRCREGEIKEAQSKPWPLPVYAPALHIRGAYIQPAPVSGFPYTQPSYELFASSFTHPLQCRLQFDSNEALSRLAAPIISLPHYAPDELWQQNPIRIKWEEEWSDWWLNDWVPNDDHPFTEEQVSRAWKLLFREPFLQEQPHLGLLMVHPTANKEKYIQRTNPLARNFAARGLYTDVIHLILHFAYEDSRSL